MFSRFVREKDECLQTVQAAGKKIKIRDKPPSFCGMYSTYVGTERKLRFNPPWHYPKDNETLP